MTNTTATTNQTTSIAFASLPALATELLGGTFAGITTRPDGTHCAVVLLTHQPTGRVNWQAAMDWAASIEAELPSRPVAALLYANCKPLLAPRWHWTSETDEDNASAAWDCLFDDGFQGYGHKSYEGSAVAVRLIPLTA